MSSGVAAIGECLSCCVGTVTLCELRMGAHKGTLLREDGEERCKTPSYSASLRGSTLSHHCNVTSVPFSLATTSYSDSFSRSPSRPPQHASAPPPLRVAGPRGPAWERPPALPPHAGSCCGRLVRGVRGAALLRSTGLWAPRKCFLAAQHDQRGVTASAERQPPAQPSARRDRLVLFCC